MSSSAFGRKWSSNPSGKCSYERPTRGTVCGTMRSMCGADAGCSAIDYQSLSGVSRVGGMSSLCFSSCVTRGYQLSNAHRISEFSLHRSSPSTHLSPMLQGLLENKVDNAVGAYSIPMPMGLGQPYER